jgi:hypothetical protein
VATCLHLFHGSNHFPLCILDISVCVLSPSLDNKFHEIRSNIVPDLCPSRYLRMVIPPQIFVKWINECVVTMGLWIYPNPFNQVRITHMVIFKPEIPLSVYLSSIYLSIYLSHISLSLCLVSLKKTRKEKYERYNSLNFRISK